MLSRSDKIAVLEQSNSKEVIMQYKNYSIKLNALSAKFYIVRGSLFVGGFSCTADAMTYIDSL